MGKVLGVIGCGKMAYALLKGMNIAGFDFERIFVCDIVKDQEEAFVREFNAVAANHQDLVENSDMILIAVKPNQVISVLEATRMKWKKDKLLISIAAGIKTIDMEGAIQVETPVIRVMPNTPSLVSQGLAAISAGQFAREIDLRVVESMMNSVGESIIMEENLINAVTAISGSGPAYIYLVVESMIDAAIHVGFNSEIAKKLVLQTMKGSLAMVEQTGKHPAVLKQEVCSPAGTTIAAIKQFEEDGIRKAFFNAVEKAYKRAQELSN